MDLRRHLERRPGRALLALALVSLLALPLARQLRIETDLLSLLPDGSPAAEAYGLFVEYFGGFEKVFVLILPTEGAAEGLSGEDLTEAAEEVQQILALHPEVRTVRSGLEPEDEDFILRFVLRRAPLLVPSDRLDQVAERLDSEQVAQRVARLRAALRRPGGAAEFSLDRHDPLGFRDFLPLLQSSVGGLTVDPVTGAFVSPSGEAALLFLTPTRGELDPAGGRALAQAIEEACDEVGEPWQGAVRCLALGGPLYAAQDEASLRRDLRTTVTGSLLGCLMILVLALGGWRLPATALVVLALALLWSAAAFASLGGHLDALSLGFAAVLVGLGVDYVIHGTTSYRQRRLGGNLPWDALGATFQRVGPAVTTSALTTAAAFLVLSQAHFGPLRQLGVLVGLGILAILLASATAGGLWLLWTPVRGGEGTWLWRSLGRWTQGAVRRARAYPRAVLGVAGVWTLLAVVLSSQLEVDADPRRLRAEDHPALRAEVVLHEQFELGTDTATVLIPGASLDQVLEHSAAVVEILRRAEPRIRVTAAADWLPAAREGTLRLETLVGFDFDAAATHLETALAENGFRVQAFEPGIQALRAFGQGLDPGPPVEADWPQPLAELLRRGPEGHWTAVRLRLPEGLWASAWPPEVLEEMEMRAPGFHVASARALGGELKRVAVGDLERLGGLAFSVVVLVVLLSFRGRLGKAVLALLPVTLGVLWTFGIAGALGWPLDLFGLAVLPILLGIGIDDGLHALHGARGRERTADAITEAGRAMALTTLTTAVGFASLGLSRLPALRVGGALIALGVCACLTATVWVLPALEAWREGQKNRPKSR